MPSAIKENESVSVAEANETSAKTVEIPEMSGDFKAALSLDSQTPSPAEQASGSRPRVQEAGAKILRKASPDEIQARKAVKEKVSQFTRRASREDSKGTKYTGIGSHEDAEVRARIEVDLYRDPDKPVHRRADAKVKTSEVAETEEGAGRRPVPQKGRRQHLSSRMILRNLDDESGDFEGELAINAYKTASTPLSLQKKRDLKRRKDLKKTEITTARASYRTVQMTDNILVSELAHQLKIKSGEIIKKLMDQGLMVTLNQSLDIDTATLVANEYGFDVVAKTISIDDFIGNSEVRTGGKASKARAPIVTVMGHVDHGKTSILDAIRDTNVAGKEHGGITQHIGAYNVSFNGKPITFLDTPGHEAFGSMRARGATVTDIVVLVVAADDGVMPQTIEAISHSKDAGVPIVVAVNKIDKEGADLNRIYSALTEHGIQSEEWGGDAQFVKVSALKRIGLEDLLESILLQAEVLELKAVTDCPASGVVVEAHIDTGRGPVATVIVKEGTLKSGDFIVAGTQIGRVRTMNDYRGVGVTEAGPSMPVEILGLSAVPLAGDQIHAVKDEKTARDIASWRQVGTQAKPASSSQTLEDLLAKMKTADALELPVIVKGDTQGSVEAIVESITKINTDAVKNKVVHRGVGGISESDLSLAEASGAVIIGFNVRAARGLDDSAQKRGILIKYFSIIYDLVDTVKGLMAGKLPPIEEEVFLGRAEVREPISVPKIGTVAGSAVIDGRITRTAHLRLIRDDIVIYAGKIASLRRFKDDVKEVKSGYECGISIENYNDIKPGDVIEAFEIQERKATL